MAISETRDLITRYLKNSNIIRTTVQYAPQTLTGKSMEKVSLAVQCAPALRHPIQTRSMTQTALLSESIAHHRQIRRPRHRQWWRAAAAAR